jgi:hypothetical protein
MKRHTLKCWPEYFQAYIDGRKRFEFRVNDRDYQLGDMLIVREWSPISDEYSGREFVMTVQYLCRLNVEGESFVIMS